MVNLKKWSQMPGSTCNSSTREVEAGESGVKRHPVLHSELEASLGYLRKRKWCRTNSPLSCQEIDTQLEKTEPCGAFFSKSQQKTAEVRWVGEGRDHPSHLYPWLCQRCQADSMWDLPPNATSTTLGPLGSALLSSACSGCFRFSLHTQTPQQLPEALLDTAVHLPVWPSVSERAGPPSPRPALLPSQAQRCLKGAFMSHFADLLGLSA